MEKFGKLPPILAEFMAEYLADKRGILFPVGNIQAQAVDLTQARIKERIEIQGDFVFADSDSTGTGYLRFNNPSMPAMPFRTNTGVYGFPIKEVFLTNAAQVGKVLNLWYGYGARVIPPNQDITTIGSITQPIQTTESYGVSFSTTSVLAANTPQNILAAASNLAGVRLSTASRRSYRVTFGTIGNALLAKATAPANIIDGDSLMQFLGMYLNNAATDQISTSHSATPTGTHQLVPLGKRLDFIVDAAEGATYGNCNYTVL